MNSKKMRICIFLLIATMIFCGCEKNDNTQDELYQDTLQINLVSSKEYSPALKSLIADFEETDGGMRVNLVEMNGDLDKLYDIYSASLGSHSDAFDVYLVDNTWIENLGKKGCITPLDDRNMASDKYIDVFVKDCYVDGTLFAKPFSANLDWIYYRKDLLEKVPATWEEWVTAGRRAADEGVVKYGGVAQCVGGDEMMTTAREMIKSCGDTDSGLELYKSIAEMGDSTLTSDCNRYVKAFSAGSALFMKGSTPVWHTVNGDGSAVGMKVGVAPLPADAEGKPTSLLCGTSLVVSKYSNNADRAAKLIDYLTDTEAQTQAAIMFGVMPVIADVYDNYRVIEENPHFKTIDTDKFGSYVKKSVGSDYLVDVTETENAVKDFLLGKSNTAQTSSTVNKFLSKYR